MIALNTVCTRQIARRRWKGFEGDSPSTFCLRAAEAYWCMAISFLSWHGGPVVVLGVGALGVIDELAPRMALELASEALNVWECVLRADAPS